MWVKVDGDSGALTVGPEDWPVEPDGLSGSVVVRCAAVSYRVRPLRWSEKLVLARLATLGPAVRRRALLQACVTSESKEPPKIPQLIEALVAVAEWVNATPDGANPVADHPAALAAVALDVMRATGMSAADLAVMDAVQVEMLWQASGGDVRVERSMRQASSDQSVARGTADAVASEPVEDGLTRILIVPDAESDANSAEASEPEQSETDAPEDEPRGISEENGARGAEGENSALWTRERTGVYLARFAMPLRENVDAPAQAPTPEIRAAENSPRRAFVSPYAPVARSERGNAVPEMEHPPSAPPSSHRLTGAFDELDMRRETDPTPWADPRMAPDVSPVEQSTQPSADNDALWDELSERLEQAAAEMGIDTD